MNGPDVSVIMPAYNAAPWIGRAVESVLWQRGPSWELLIIDDGSSDGARETAEFYAALDPRVRVLDNQRGKGAAGARNTGMRAARGRALFFLDSDDALAPGGLAALHGPLMKGEHPVVRGGGVIFCEQRWLAAYLGAFANSGRVSVCEARPHAGFWLHMYRADFLERGGIDFPEDMVIGEDTTFLCRVYARLREVVVVDRRVYYYRINHKRALPSFAKAASFARRALLARESFDGNGRREWIAPYLAASFLPEWLRHLHAALRADGNDPDRAKALSYLSGCRTALAGLENELAPALREQFGPLHGEFTAVWETGDNEAALEFLLARGFVRPAYPYMGIEMLPKGPKWLWFRWSRRAANLVRGHIWEVWRVLFALRRRALRRRAGTPAKKEARP